MKAGRQNAITDIAGLRVGHAHAPVLKSGSTVLLVESDTNVASVHVAGGAPGTRDIALLAPENTVQSVDALVLSGGSAFGLDSASGVQMALRRMGRGFAVGDQRVPIVPAAILFDLINGGNKGFDENPYAALGAAAVKAAAHTTPVGTIGAGYGALTGGPLGGLKGGLGTASTILSDGSTIGALVAVNALGSPVTGDGPHLRAAPFEILSEFGGLGVGSSTDSDRLDIKFADQQNPGANTTIGIIATDATLTKGQAKRLAIAAHDGFAHALWPAHTPLDGDLIFGLSTCDRPANDDMGWQIELAAAAASTMARAIAQGVHAAKPADNDLFPCWSALSAD